MRMMARMVTARRVSMQVLSSGILARIVREPPRRRIIADFA